LDDIKKKKKKKKKEVIQIKEFFGSARGFLPP